MFKISDYYELLALHRALLEAQFCDEPNDEDITSSPIVARLHRELLKSLVTAAVERNGEQAKTDWNEWLHIDVDRREWKVALDRARREEQWSAWDEADKQAYVFNLLSPFEVDDDLVQKFILMVWLLSIQHYGWMFSQ